MTITRQEYRNFLNKKEFYDFETKIMAELNEDLREMRHESLRYDALKKFEWVTKWSIEDFSNFFNKRYTSIFKFIINYYQYFDFDKDSVFFDQEFPPGEEIEIESSDNVVESYYERSFAVAFIIDFALIEIGNDEKLTKYLKMQRTPHMKKYIRDLKRIYKKTITSE